MDLIMWFQFAGCDVSNSEYMYFTVHVINTGIPISNYCILFDVHFFQPQTMEIFKFQKKRAFCELSATKCQHCIADIAYPPRFEQRRKRATANNKSRPHVTC